jgi:hypothetical protein
MGTPNQFAARQGRSERCKAPAQPLQPKPAAPARGSLCVPMLPRVQFSSAPWQRERVQRLARISRCLDRGCAAGKPLRKMLVRFAWKWNGRRYKGEPARRMRLAKATLRYLYRRWKASGGNPAALALNYRAPVKVRKGHALDFARVCVNSDVQSFTEAHGRLPRSRATWFAYRLALPAGLRQRVVRLFSARRLVDCRTRKARAAMHSFAKGGTW